MPDTGGSRVPRRSVRLAVGLGTVVGVLAGTTLVWQTSSATFSDSTSSGGGWSAGSVTVSDDDAGRAVFSTEQDGLLVGGQSVTRCIKVTYTGSIVSGTQLRLYAAASGALAGNLDLVVDEGAGGSFGDCAGFAATTAGLYSGTLAGFAADASSFATGVAAWSPASTPQARSYRFTITVRNVPAAQNATVAGSFTWEARA